MPRLYEPAPTASSSGAGYMSASDKSKLDTLDTDAVKLSGTQTITGSKTFKGTTAIANASQHPALSFCGQNSSGTPLTVNAYIYALNASTSEGKYGDARLHFYEYAAKSDGSARHTYYERYRLPNPVNTITANQTYEILTSKSAVTVAQGGTGATTAAAALTNLGVIDAVINALYPVGSVYISFNSSMPSYLTSGRTWVAITGGYVLKTVTSGTGGTTTAAGNTGSHTLTVSEIPSHTHSYPTGYDGFLCHVTDGTLGKQTLTGSGSDYVRYRTPNSTGGGGGHTHTAGMPANVAIYMWKRTK